MTPQVDWIDAHFNDLAMISEGMTEAAQAISKHEQDISLQVDALLYATPPRWQAPAADGCAKSWKIRSDQMKKLSGAMTDAASEVDRLSGKLTSIQSGIESLARTYRNKGVQIYDWAPIPLHLVQPGGAAPTADEIAWLKELGDANMSAKCLRQEAWNRLSAVHNSIGDKGFDPFNSADWGGVVGWAGGALGVVDTVFDLGEEALPTALKLTVAGSKKVFGLGLVISAVEGGLEAYSDPNWAKDPFGTLVSHEIDDVGSTLVQQGVVMIGGAVIAGGAFGPWEVAGIIVVTVVAADGLGHVFVDARHEDWDADARGTPGGIGLLGGVWNVTTKAVGQTWDDGVNIVKTGTDIIGNAWDGIGLPALW